MAIQSSYLQRMLFQRPLLEKAKGQCFTLWRLLPLPPKKDGTSELLIKTNMEEINTTVG